MALTKSIEIIILIGKTIKGANKKKKNTREANRKGTPLYIHTHTYAAQSGINVLIKHARVFHNSCARRGPQLMPRPWNISRSLARSEDIPSLQFPVGKSRRKRRRKRRRKKKKRRGLTGKEEEVKGRRNRNAVRGIERAARGRDAER